MNFRGNCLKWLRASLRSASFAGLILIAACWFVVALVSSVEHEKAIEGALKQSGGLVRLFEQNTVDTLERFDRTLLLLRKSFEDDPGNLADHIDRSGRLTSEPVGLSGRSSPAAQIAKFQGSALTRVLRNRPQYDDLL